MHKFELTPSMLEQIKDAVAEGNKKSKELKKETAELTALASAVTTMATVQTDISNSLNGLTTKVDRMEEKMVDGEWIDDRIKSAIEGYDYEKVKNELRAEKKKGEQSQQFVIEHMTPPEGIRSAKTPVHKNPYVTVPTSAGVGAFLIWVINLIVGYLDKGGP